ncbi:MAG: MltA domain-containing protein [Hyphomonadaceae bacterium]
MTPTIPPVAPEPAFTMTPVVFGDLPGWYDADLVPAITAFRRHCTALTQRAPDTNMPGAYGGKVRDWLPACYAAANAPAGGERAFFESYFQPARIEGPGEARLTAYFEPVIDARRLPDGAFSEPILRRPADLVTIDLGAFADAREDDALRGAPRSLTGKVENGRVEPYPKREAIAPTPGQVIGWAHPADVYNLQVQGSGRLRFEDGTEVRAAFSAQNGYKWRSALGALKATGALASVTWPSFRMWIDNNPGDTRSALNADPSYVFFSEEAVTDYAAGPRGAAGIPLTPMGSIAVDPAFHPYGAIVFVDGEYNGAPFQRLLVAQDTGGAIRRGPQRGDVFFGTGADAGAAAERMNAPARWWTLLPRPVVDPPFAALPSVDDTHRKG